MDHIGYKALFPFLMVFVILLLPASSQPANTTDPGTVKTVVFDENSDRTPIGLPLEYFEDKAGSLTFEDVSSPDFADRFTAGNESVLNFGYNDSAWWLKFVVEYRPTYAVPIKSRLLEIGNPHLDIIELYAPDEYGKYEIKPAGDTLPFKERAIINPNFLFKLTLEPYKKKTIYIRIMSEGNLRFPLTIRTIEAYMAYSNKRQLTCGIFYGIVMIMILYNFFIFVSLKDTNYLYYILCAIGLLGLQLSIDGLAFQYLWPNLIRWGNRSIPFFIGFTLFWMAILSRSFLQTGKFSPALNITFLSSAVFSGIIMFLSLAAKYSLAIQTGASFGIAFPVFCVIASINAYSHGQKNARFFLLAWLIYCFGCTIIGLDYWGLIPSSWLTSNALRIGSIPLVTLLSFSLADRVNIMGRGKMEAQKADLEAKNEALEKLERGARIRESYTRNLENRVVERTLELKETNQRLKKEIEDRQKAEGEKNRSREVSRIIVDNIEDGYYELDLAGNVEYISRMSSEILGRPPEEITGRNYAEFCDETSAKEIHAFYRQIYETGQAATNFNWNVLLPDGSLKLLELTAALIRDSNGQPTGFRGIIRDMTARRKAEAILSEAKTSV